MSDELKLDVEIKSKVEALLFAADRPVSATKLAQIIGNTDARVVKKAIQLLREEYDGHGRSFQVEEIADGYQILTRPEFRRYVVQLRRSTAETRLSQAALETLAIISYRQPVLRAQVEGIRGVQAGELIRGLMEKNLVKIIGRANVVSRPILYGTTRRFLEHFGLKSLKDLPKMEEVLPLPSRPSPTGGTGPFRPETPPAQPAPESSQGPAPVAVAEGTPQPPSAAAAPASAAATGSEQPAPTEKK
jgi:segregation and condensation protein B